MAETKKPVEKGPAKAKVPVDLTLLTGEERAALTKEARVALDKAKKQAASDAFYAAEVERLRRAEIPEEHLIPITIDLAPFTGALRIDNRDYFHGSTYYVVPGLHAVLMEQMFRTWKHQDEIDGRAVNNYRPRSIRMGMQHVGLSPQQIMQM